MQIFDGTFFSEPVFLTIGISDANDNPPRISISPNIEVLLLVYILLFDLCSDLAFLYNISYLIFHLSYGNIIDKYLLFTYQYTLTSQMYLNNWNFYWTQFSLGNLLMAV